MKNSIKYRSILVFILKSIPVLVILWAGFNGGLIEGLLREARMYLSGSSLNARENTPIVARRKLVELVEQKLLPDMNFLITLNPNEFNDKDKYFIYHDQYSAFQNFSGYNPSCRIEITADKTVYPFNESYGAKKYAHKKEMDFYFILLHEASHCTFKLHKLNSVFNPQIEEAFADVHGFILLYKNLGYSQEMINLLDMWIFRRKFMTSTDYGNTNPDIVHDSSLVLTELRREFLAHHLPEDKDIIAYSLKLVLKNPPLLSMSAITP